jgi:hypothetical protein
MAAMHEFLADYAAPCQDKRYVAASLPALPFANGSFDLTICSHFLFLYGEELSFEFHLRSVLELCRVSAEVRIFPLLNLQGGTSRHVKPIVAELSRRELPASIERVPYEFQRGGNEMMRIHVKQLSAGDP